MGDKKHGYDGAKVYSFDEVVKYAKLYSEVMEMGFAIDNPQTLRLRTPVPDMEGLAGSALGLIDLYRREVPKEVRSRFDAQEDSLDKRCREILDSSSKKNK